MENPVEINLKSTTLEVLLKYVRDGVEATAGTWMLPWRARKESEASQILAESEAHRIRIIAEGQDDALDTLLKASLGSDRAAELKNDIGDTFISARGQKRFNNFHNVVIGAAQELAGKDVKDHEPDPDFPSRLFVEVQDVSSKRLQSLWSKILAGEIQSPGQTSIRTLVALRNMSQQDASQFERLASYVINGDFIFFSSHFRENVQFSSDLSYADFQFLSECDLITPFDSSAFTVNWGPKEQTVLSYHNYHLSIKKMPGAKGSLPISAQRLTKAGRELYQIINAKVHTGYLTDLSTYLDRKQCQLFLLEGYQELPDGTTKYEKKIRIEPGISHFEI